LSQIPFERLSHEIGPAVAQAHTDIGVLADLTGVEGLETYPFRIDRLVVVVPRGHKLAARRDATFAEVLDEEFVGLEAGNTLAEHIAWQAARLGCLRHGAVGGGNCYRAGNGR
jgi:DNA-binding transcriptional LysR family regulator